MSSVRVGRDRGVPYGLRLCGDWHLWLRSDAVRRFVTARRLVTRCRAEYPGSRHADRVVDCAYDQRITALQIAPFLAGAVGLSSQEIARLAMGRRFSSCLATTAAVGDPESQARVADDLQPMAAARSQERMVGRFVTGKAIPAPTKPSTAQGLGTLAAQRRTLAHSASCLIGRG